METVYALRYAQFIRDKRTRAYAAMTDADRQVVADEAAMSFGDDCPRDQMDADERAAVAGAWERATA